MLFYPFFPIILWAAADFSAIAGNQDGPPLKSDGLKPDYLMAHFTQDKSSTSGTPRLHFLRDHL
jgi:hypothetical protein